MLTSQEKEIGEQRVKWCINKVKKVYQEFDQKENTKVWCAYILRSTIGDRNLTYCGCTNNIRNRLRKHNGIIKGGGHYTTSNLFNKEEEYRPWKLAAIIIPLEGKSQSLSVEWFTKAKNYKSKTGIPTSCVKKRMWLIHNSIKVNKIDKSLLHVFDPQFKKFL
jgi:predicted GIY-YIG superfamily endonuclease